MVGGWIEEEEEEEEGKAEIESVGWGKETANGDEKSGGKRNEKIHRRAEYELFCFHVLHYIVLTTIAGVIRNYRNRTSFLFLPLCPGAKIFK